MKILLSSVVFSLLLMLLSRLFGAGSPPRPVDLDGLASLELPTSFHLDETPEQRLPPARRLRRQPYLHLPASADHLTYYPASYDSQGFGGRKVPVLLRVTLYADDVPLPEALDRAYFHAIAQQNYHYDGQREAVYVRALVIMVVKIIEVAERTPCLRAFSRNG